MTTQTMAPATLPPKKREIFGWAMYDFANSSYTTIVISILYSAFFVSYLVPDDSKWHDVYWSIAMNISTLIAMFAGPLAGILCDYSGRKKVYLGLTTVVCALFTMLLFFVQPGQIWFGILLIVVSNTAWMLGEVFCASFLTDLADNKNMSKISGIGWGIGYVGGLTSLIVVLFGIVTADPSVDPDAYVRQHQWAMVFTGVFFLAAAIPTFLLVKERSVPKPGFEKLQFRKLFGAAANQMKHSWKIVKDLPVLFEFFLVFTLYSAAMAIIVQFVGIYIDAELNMSQGQKTTIFLALQVSAMVGAIAFGYLERFLGPKNTIMATLIWWMMGVLGIYFLVPLSNMVGMTPQNFFTIIGIVAGAGLGATQSSSRAVVGLLSPKAHASELFGFWGLFVRLSTIIGSMSFAIVSDTMGRQTALLVILGFFFLGAVALSRLNIDKGVISH